MQYHFSPPGSNLYSFQLCVAGKILLSVDPSLQDGVYGQT